MSLEILLRLKVALRYKRSHEQSSTLIQSNNAVLKKMTTKIVISSNEEEHFDLNESSNWTWERRNMKTSNVRTRVISINLVDGTWLRLTFVVSEESDPEVCRHSKISRELPRIT